MQGCHLWHRYILSTTFPSLTSSTITIICWAKIPFLLQCNYHQSLSFSLHNECQETLRAPVQELALDPQSPDWDNVCRLPVEEKKKSLGVGVQMRKWVWGGRLWSPPLPFNCCGNWEIKSNSESLVSIIQTEWERQRRHREGRKSPSHHPSLFPISDCYYCKTPFSTAFSSQRPKPLFQLSDNHCSGNGAVWYGQEMHREEAGGRGRRSLTFSRRKGSGTGSAGLQGLRVDVSNAIGSCDSFVRP